MASDRFQFSYQQVYTWVKKYRDQGYEALIDRRGQCKNSEELSESEKLAAQFKLLEAKPNQKWLTDVTEFKLTNGQKVYLSAMLNLGDRSIVSYVLGHSNNN
jgi:transposase InsO family protein